MYGSDKHRADRQEAAAALLSIAGLTFVVPVVLRARDSRPARGLAGGSAQPTVSSVGRA
jgi:hypothetical protein